MALFNANVGVDTPFFPVAEAYHSGAQILPATYYGTFGGTLVTGAITYCPFLITRDVTISHIVLTNNNSVNTISFRVGLFAANGRLPGSLLRESASTTVNDTNTTTKRVIALASTITIPKGLYFAGAQASSNASMYTCSNVTGIPNGLRDFGEHGGQYTESQAYGAFPSTATPVLTLSPTTVAYALLEVD